MDDEKITVYILPTDSYGQPNGYINETTMTRSEYEIRKNGYEYIYDNYAAANWRANA
jgi:hypothetical protein